MVWSRAVIMVVECSFVISPFELLVRGGTPLPGFLVVVLCLMNNFCVVDVVMWSQIIINLFCPLWLQQPG